MNALQSFQYQNHEIRTIQRGDATWFVLRDVCQALGIQNVTAVYERLDEDEKGVCQTNTLGGPQTVRIINESGLYSVILRSDKPEARPFRKWVTAEVLPAIRQTGTYRLLPVVPVPEGRELTTDDYLKAATIVSNCRNERLPYVLGFLEQAGLHISTLPVEEDPVSTLVQVLNNAIARHGLTVRGIGALTKIDASTISGYRLGKHRPTPERAAWIIQVVQGAIGGEEAWS